MRSPGHGLRDASDPRYTGSDAIRRAGAPAGRPPAAVRPTRGCRSGWSPGWRGPSSSCTARRSAPPSSRWVAAVCRSPCGPMSGAPGTSATRRCTIARTVRGSIRPPRTPSTSAAPDRGPCERRPALGEPASSARRRPGRTARCAPCRPCRAPAAPAGAGRRRRVEADQLGDPHAGGVEQFTTSRSRSVDGARPDPRRRLAISRSASSTCSTAGSTRCAFGLASS